MTDQQKRQLLRIARQAADAALRGLPVPQDVPEDPALHEPRGAFVTLHNRGELRGCIGRFEPVDPLYLTVRNMAVAAATEDPRFRMYPVTAVELTRIDIEISVLSPLVKTDNPLSLQLGTHGVYIRQGYAAGCFLPQVATETGWSKEEFLSYCCASKAGMNPDAWKQPDTDVYLFTADIFHESNKTNQ